MAKNDAPDDVVVDPPVNNKPVIAAPPVVPDMALEDWCSDKSQRLGRRIEALAAFHKLCQNKGIGRATADAFEAQFQAFLKQPA